jgi:predicted ATP-grasp superfamily ATP-dependent carboligase
MAGYLSRPCGDPAHPTFEGPAPGVERLAYSFGTAFSARPGKECAFSTAVPVVGIAGILPLSTMRTGHLEHKSSVVVVGEGLNCLGVIRSLAGAGVPVVAVTTTRRCVVGCSRFAQVEPLPALEGRALVDGLVSLGRRLGGRPVLMLGGDRQVAAVNEARAELEPLFRIALPPPERVRALADKALFQAFAEANGLPVPRTVVVNGSDGLARLDELVPPLVLKPADKAQVLSGHVDRALRVETLAEARTAAARMSRAAGSVVAQEWIEGDDSDIYFALFACGRDGRIAGMFCGRKLVCEPPGVGNTAMCAPAGAAAAEIGALAARFVSVSEYRGIGGIEFKRDRRTGRFLIVEPTVGRTDWQAEIATLNGVNLPLLAVLDELGEPPRPAPSAEAAAGPTPTPAPASTSAATASHATIAVRAVAPQAWRSSVTYRRPRATLADDVRMVDGWFRLGDPLPGVYHYLVDAFARRAVRRLGRLLRLERVRRDPPQPLERRLP